MKHFELIAYQDLNQEGKELVLKMRNHSSIRVWMHNRDEIKLQQHLEFIEKLKSASTTKYFLVKDEDDVIGCVNFTSIDLQEQKAEVGLYANPFNEKRGKGDLLVEAIFDYAFVALGLRKIYLEVFANNQRAIDLYKRSGFKLRDSGTQSENLLRMEKEVLV